MTSEWCRVVMCETGTALVLQHRQSSRTREDLFRMKNDMRYLRASFFNSLCLLHISWVPEENSKPAKIDWLLICHLTERLHSSVDQNQMQPFEHWIRSWMTFFVSLMRLSRRNRYWQWLEGLAICHGPELVEFGGGHNKNSRAYPRLETVGEHWEFGKSRQWIPRTRNFQDTVFTAISSGVVLPSCVQQHCNARRKYWNLTEVVCILFLQSNDSSNLDSQISSA